MGGKERLSNQLIIHSPYSHIHVFTCAVGHNQKRGNELALLIRNLEYLNPHLLIPIKIHDSFRLQFLFLPNNIAEFSLRRNMDPALVRLRIFFCSQHNFHVSPTVISEADRKSQITPNY